MNLAEVPEADTLPDCPEIEPATVVIVNGVGVPLPIIYEPPPAYTTSFGL